MNIKLKIIPSVTKHQSGVVLVIALIMLIALTIIGLTASNVTGLEEKMAGNAKDLNLAFQAAEAALLEAEKIVVETQPNFYYPPPATDVGICDNGQGVDGIYTLVKQQATSTNVNLRLFDDQANAEVPCPVFYEGDKQMSDGTIIEGVDWNATANPKPAIYDNASEKLKGLYQSPRYIIEQVSRIASGTGAASGAVTKEAGAGNITTEKNDVVLRITARGWGSNENSVVTLQSVIKVSY